MAMTAAVKDEISRLPVTRTCCRKAEVSAVLRFAGGLHLVSGRIVIEAELDTARAARRLKQDILEIFGHGSELIVMAPGGLRRGSRFVVRVVAGGDQLARQTGLVDGRGRPIRGLPPQVVSGATCDAEAARRGGFRAPGSLTEPARCCYRAVSSPGWRC
ncbi:DNA-binding protein WhiA, partial [Streptomyces sp. NPDC059409]|uniref:DNA-binding protein WhiA n=1 Tax=Streptomyces sp. NPDC059409 TaxID=3346824 RepID=UPI0036AF45D3